jgi:hypothetical protein
MEAQISIGYIDIPVEYAKLNDAAKKAICNKLIDEILIDIDKKLPVYVNRFRFLDEILDSSIESNNVLENYEISQTLYDMKKIINFDS